MAIRRWCPVCDGDGCKFCYFTGVRTVGNVEEIYGIFLASEVWEVTTSADYQEISGEDEDDYLMILSLGFVNLSPDSRARTRLWEIFGGGSTPTTLTNLNRLVEVLEIPDVSPEPE